MHVQKIRPISFKLAVIWHEKERHCDSTEVFIDLQENDDSYGIPHGTLNKNRSNQEDSPHLPDFSNKTNQSIRIDVSP